MQFPLRPRRRALRQPCGIRSLDGRPEQRALVSDQRRQDRGLRPAPRWAYEMTTGVAPRARSGSRSTLWKGTDRYEILRIVGEGGMGVVYEANDRERGQRVALKLLQNFSPEALYLFKQEFRTLADVRHRNLVRLHELAVDGDQVFFTMELVLGTDVLSYVRSKVVALGRSSSQHPTRYMTPPDGRRDDAPSRAQTTAQTVAPDLDRLRPTFCQLVEGIRALHAAGKLHRDIKPSNVLVTND